MKIQAEMKRISRIAKVESRTVKSHVKKTFSLIKRDKFLFIALICIQVIFLSFLFSIQYGYWIKIMEDGAYVLDYLQENVPTEGEAEQSIGTSMLFSQSLLKGDSVMVYRKAKAMARNFLFLVLATMGTFVFFSGVSWSWTDHFINKKGVRHFVMYYLRFFVVAVVYLLVLLVLLLLLMQSMIGDEKLGFGVLSYLITAVMIIVAGYMVVSFALVSRTGLKGIYKRTLSVVKANYGLLLMVFLINILITLILGYVIFLVAERNILLLIAGVVMFLASVVWARLFLLVVVDKQIE